MTLEITLSGKLEAGVTKENFFDYLGDFAQKHQLRYREYNAGDSAIMTVCPEGEIDCTLVNEFVSISAFTNIAGPGFHAFVTALFDEMIETSGIALEVEDTTDYFEKRDYAILKENHFMPWLEEVISYIEEHGDDENICVGWSTDVYMPKQKVGYIVTPMGYIARTAFRYDQVAQLAEQMFIWNQKEKDASYYRNCALHLIWKQCYFEYSMMNEESSKAAYQIIDYIDAAYAADQTIPLPYALYHQLCTVMQCEDLINEESNQEEQIGYRCEPVYYLFNDWSILSPGTCERFMDEAKEQPELILNGPYINEFEPWNWMMHIKECSIADRIGQEDFRFMQHGVTVSGSYQHVEGYYGMHVYATYGQQCIELLIHYREAQKEAELMHYLQGIRHQVIHDEAETQVH